MVAEAARRSTTRLMGRAHPRLAPPEPAKSLLSEFEACATELGIKLMPWQRIAARYMTAVQPWTTSQRVTRYRQRQRGVLTDESPSANARWLYRRVATVVSRQNGKSELIKPRILLGLRLGRKMLHTAQDRALPRETFEAIAEWFEANPEKRAVYGITKIREANGTESIRASNGGSYRLVSPRRGAARGRGVDDVFLDEVREYKDDDIERKIRPTVIAQPNGQVLYFSNAGEEDSVVLNDLRRQAESLQSLCYLEWSAAPERDIDDREGWAEANPALGITITEDSLADFRASLAPSAFETEHLCRWVVTTMPTLVGEDAWAGLVGTLPDPVQPMIGVSLDPSGQRASAVSAWLVPESGQTCLRVEEEYTGNPIDSAKLRDEVRALAIRLRAPKVAYSKVTDAPLVTDLRNAVAIDGREFEEASAGFARLVGGRGLTWDDADGILALDLRWTGRKMTGDMRTFHAVRVKEDRPITAALAAIRAVELVTRQARTGPARIY